MKKNILLSLPVFLFLALPFGAFSQSNDSQSLQIKIANIKSAEGNIMVAVFDSSQEFLGAEVVAGKIAPVTQTGEMTVVLKGLSYGKYAISIFHDENSNEILDSNFFKIPKEPYGFSNNAKGIFGPPSFDDAMIDFTSNQQKFTIRLK